MTDKTIIKFRVIFNSYIININMSVVSSHNNKSIFKLGSEPGNLFFKVNNTLVNFT